MKLFAVALLLDIGEARDLASSEPDRMKQLAAKLAAWRDAVGATVDGRHRPR